MRLSEAIRLGAMMKPQCTCGFLYFKGTTCAVGAAMDAVGQLEARSGVWEAGEVFPLLRTIVRSRPEGVSLRGTYSLGDLIWRLNDRFGWTREQIADWVSEIEKEQENAAKGEADNGAFHGEREQDGVVLAVVGADR